MCFEQKLETQEMSKTQIVAKRQLPRALDTDSFTAFFVTRNSSEGLDNTSPRYIPSLFVSPGHTCCLMPHNHFVSDFLGAGSFLVSMIRTRGQLTLERGPGPPVVSSVTVSSSHFPPTH